LQSKQNTLKTVARHMATYRYIQPLQYFGSLNTN